MTSDEIAYVKVSVASKIWGFEETVWVQVSPEVQKINRGYRHKQLVCIILETVMVTS